MTRYEKLMRELTEEKMIDLMAGQIGEELYNSQSPWCCGEQARICKWIPDGSKLPCRECIRKWIREEVQE